MAGIFTRAEIAKILGDESLDADERTNRIMSLRGRDLDESYISKSAAKAAQETAIEQAKAEWEKALPKPDIKASAEYKALETEYAGYKAMQTARMSDDFKQVKGKFFDAVYGMIDKGENAKPIPEQLTEIRGKYEEYFTPVEEPKKTPQFSQQAGRTGTNTDSEEDKLFKQLSEQWK